jgi:hypothetical protein
MLRYTMHLGTSVIASPMVDMSDEVRVRAWRLTRERVPTGC